MTIPECQVETMKHIEKVREIVWVFIEKLASRAFEHDKAKLESPEVEVFAEYTPKLAETVYGSEEYMQNLKEMNGALQHHYAQYRHHPEHFDKGVDDMTLVDLIEMFCDWKASTARQIDGNLLKSIETNAGRFNMSKQLKQIFVNTAKMYDE